MTTPAVRGRAKHGAAAMVSVLLLAGCNSSTDVAVDAAPPNEPPYQKTMEVAELEFELVRAARETYEDQPGAPELVTAEARYKDYLTNSHIHAAYGIYDCAQSAGAEWLEPINGTGDEDTVGIHAHDDGLIHAHPFSERAAGKNAVLQLFFTVTGISVTSNRIYVPVKVGYGQPEQPQRMLDSSVPCVDGQPSVIRSFEYVDAVVDGKKQSGVTGTQIDGDVADVRIRAGCAYAFARIPNGFIPPLPPSVDKLVYPQDGSAIN